MSQLLELAEVVVDQCEKEALLKDEKPRVDAREDHSYQQVIV
jgi:hypothetical protein